MTLREKVIVSAYTGILMCDFHEMHKYIEEKLGRPVWTHEFALDLVQRQIKKAVEPDFMALCDNGLAEKGLKGGGDNGPVN